MKNDSQHTRFGLARVLGHPVEAPGRLVERIAGLERFGGLVIDGPLVLSLYDVPEHGAGMAMRRAGLTRLKSQFHRRRFSLFTVELFDDVALRERGPFRVALVWFVVTGESQPNDREGGQGYKCPFHRDL